VEDSVSRLFDLAVIGGGPAGTSAAITVARLGFDVLLLEAGTFPRHKVCGEFVSGEAVSMLDQLLGTNCLTADVPRISRARVFLDDRVAEFPLAPAAASLTRHALDLALWLAAAREGVVAQDRSRVKAVRWENDRFAVEIEGQQFSARTTMNATGRWSNITAEKSPSGDHCIGMKRHFIESDPSPSCDLYFFDGGYCGVQPIGRDRVNAAAVVRADIARDLPAVFQANRFLAGRSRRWQPTMEPVSTAPLLFRPPRTSRDRMVFVGDAAAFIDPFAGYGISMALHTGQLAALALVRYLHRECSLDAALRTYDLAHKALIQPTLRNAARLRQLAQLPRAFRVAAMSLLGFPALARLAVERTRLQKAS